MVRESLFLLLLLLFQWLIKLHSPNKTKLIPREQKKVSISFAIEDVELMREYSPEHLRMEAVRLK